MAKAGTPTQAEMPPTGTDPAGESKVGAPSRLKLALIISMTLTFVGGGTWLFFQKPGPTPAQTLQQALDHLDAGENAAARAAAKNLEELGYHDPNFAGGTEFILGMVAFREAEDRDEAARDQWYILAANYLREAERRALLEARRPEWCFALGVSLHRIGAAADARPLLEEAVETYPVEYLESALLLADIYLYLSDENELEKALKLNTSVIKMTDLDAADHSRAYLQRAQILLGLNRHADAELALAEIADESVTGHGTIVLRAQTKMAEGKYQEAMLMMAPIANDPGLERTYPRQASYLMGVCAQALDDRDAAITFYRRTIQIYERSHEALAASLWLGDVLRKIGRREEALEAYGQALRMVRRPEDFRNRWIELSQFQNAILAAWTDWIDQEYFAESIALSELMTPLFPADKAYERAALANQRWAEHLQKVFESLPYSQQAIKREELERHWNRSGEAYARLALARTTSALYPEAIWASASQYMNGHDFENAVSQLTQFIDSQPSKLVPAAMMMRGKANLHLGKIDDALTDLQEVLRSFPTDPVSFETRYLIGQCYVEKSELDQAEKVWRAVLSLPELTPKAREWRLSLYSLGKLLYRRGEFQRREIKLAELNNRDSEAQQLQTTNFATWTDAIANLDQYLARYPESSEQAEIRYLLAQCWQRSAEFLENRLRTAETDNARTDFRRRMIERLEIAMREFLEVRSDLRTLFEADRLDRLGQTYLRDCYFQVAAILYSLGRYDEAIAAYSTAANRYQFQAETLQAYVQMANCYQNLSKPAEARSMLEQAKIILKQIPDEAFLAPSSNLDRQEWERWLNWAMTMNP